jgi:hypothetical protein
MYVVERPFVACPCLFWVKEIEQDLVQNLPRPSANRFSEVIKGVLHFLQLTVRRLNIVSSSLYFNIKQGRWHKGCIGFNQKTDF